jgi:hypothetical protein
MKLVPNGSHWLEAYCMSNSIGYYRIEGGRVFKYDGYVFKETGIAVADVCEDNDFVKLSDKYDQNY